MGGSFFGLQIPGLSVVTGDNGGGVTLGGLFNIGWGSGRHCCGHHHHHRPMFPPPPHDCCCGGGYGTGVNNGVVNNYYYC